MSLLGVIADGASGLSPLFRHCPVALTQALWCLARTLFVFQGQVLEMHDEEHRGRKKQGILDGQAIICLCGCGITMKGELDSDIGRFHLSVCYACRISATLPR